MCAYCFWKKNPPCALLLGPVRLIKFQKKKEIFFVLWNSRLREPFSAFFRQNNCLHLGHGMPRAPCAAILKSRKFFHPLQLLGPVRLLIFWYIPPCALIRPCSCIRQTRVGRSSQELLCYCCCCVKSFSPVAVDVGRSFWLLSIAAKPRLSRDCHLTLRSVKPRKSISDVSFASRPSTNALRESDNK